MLFDIDELVEGVDFKAKVLLLNETYKYYQITPCTGHPFFMRFDKYSGEWKAVAEIYPIDPLLVEVVGNWLSDNSSK